MIFYIIILVLVLLVMCYGSAYRDMRSTGNPRTIGNISAFTRLANTFYIDSDSKNILTDSIGKVTLFITSHDYNIFDGLPLVHIFRENTKQTYHIIQQNYFTNYITEQLFAPMLDNIKYIRTGTNVVNRVTKCLSDNDNAMMFLRKEKKATGGFHIAKNSKCDIILVRVRQSNLIQRDSSPNITSAFFVTFFSLLGLSEHFDRYFMLECKKIKLDTDVPEEFMNSVSQWLYE